MTTMTEKQLHSRTEAGRIVETLDRHKLPEPVAQMVERYEHRAGDRDRFLWKWLHYLFPEVALSCTEAIHRERVRKAKLFASMYVVLLDDLAEKHRDRRSFEEAAKIPFEEETADPDREGVDTAYVSLAEEAWAAFEGTVAGAPRRDEFGDLFQFDVKQNVNAIDYSYLVNQYPDLGNLDESTMYDCHNMMLLTYADIDLLHARPFDRADLPTLRRVLLRAQEMARIGNWVTTWERELEEGDYSSGVVVRALEENVIATDELARLRQDRSDGDAERLVSRVRDHDIEAEFLDRWHANYADVQALADDVASVDIAAYLEGMETILEFHLASRGLK